MSKSSINRRHFLAGSAAAGASLTLAAPAVQGQQSRELLMWHGYTQPQRANYHRALADRFEAKNPGLKITVEGVPPPQLHSRIVAARAAGALPDILIVNPTSAVDYFSSGFVKPVDDIVGALGPEFFLPGYLEKFGQYQGKTICLPYIWHSRLVMYRKDRLEAAGLSAPKTWDDALKAAVATTSPSNYQGWILPLNQSDRGGADALYTFALSAGGGFLNAKGDVHFASTPVREAVEFLVELTRKAGGPGVLEYRVNELFNLVNSGKTSMFIDATPLIAIAEVQAPDVASKLDAVLVPKKARDASLIQGGGVCLVDGKNKNDADAREYIKFLFEPDNHLGFLHTIPLFMYPTTRKTAGEAFYANPTVAKYRHAAELSLKAAESGYYFGTDEGGLNPFAGQIYNSGLVEQMFGRILANNTPIPEAIAITQDRMAELTRNIRRRAR